MLILAGVLRVGHGRDALLTLRLCDGEGRWCETTSFDSALLLEPALLMEAALAHAVENALGATGADALPPADRAYAQTRLRADLFPAATAERGVRVVRRLLLREVADRAVLRVTGLIFGRTATFGDYNDIVRAGARTLVRVTGETPNLAPLLRGRVRQLACEGGGGADPGILGAIRHGLVHAGPGTRIAPRDWKWLSHQTRATVEALSRRETVDDGAPLEPIALRLFTYADLRRPPASLVAMLTPGGALDRALEAMRADNGPARMADLARLVRLAAGEWRRRASTGHGSRFVRDDLGYLIDWWIDESAGRMPTVPPGATYPSLIRRQQRWASACHPEVPPFAGAMAQRGTGARTSGRSRRAADRFPDARARRNGNAPLCGQLCARLRRRRYANLRAGVDRHRRMRDAGTAPPWLALVRRADQGVPQRRCVLRHAVRSRAPCAALCERRTSALTILLDIGTARGRRYARL